MTDTKAKTWLTDDVVKEVAEYGGLAIAASTLIYNLYTKNFSPAALLGGVLLGVVWWIGVPLVKCMVLDGNPFLICAGKSAVGVIADTANAAAAEGGKALTSVQEKIFGEQTPQQRDFSDCLNKSSILTGFMGVPDPNCIAAAASGALKNPPKKPTAPSPSASVAPAVCKKSLLGFFGAADPRCALAPDPSLDPAFVAYLKAEQEKYAAETDDEKRQYGTWNKQQWLECRLKGKCVETEGHRQAGIVSQYDSADVISGLRKDPAYQPEYNAWFNKYLSYDKQTIPAFADSKQCAAAPDVRSCYIKTRAQEDAYYARLNLSDTDRVRKIATSSLGGLP